MDLMCLISGSIFASVFFAVSCVHEPFPGPPLGEQEACDMGYIDYASQIQPIFTSNCAIPGCHGGAPGDEDYNLTSYNGAMEEVDEEDPFDSDLWERINDPDEDDRMPQAPRPRLTADQINLIKQWLEQGAVNLDCNRGCDTVGTPTYLADIEPIIRQNCRGCHSGTAPQGALLLLDAQDLGDAIDNRNLLNAIQGLGTGPSMPYNADLMLQCRIDLILEWNALGRPD